MKGDEEMRKWLALGMIAVIVSLGSVVYAVDCSAGMENQEHILLVKNWKGEYIGTSRHIIMDASSGTIIFIIVSLQEEGREVPVPPSIFSIDEKDRSLVLKVSRKDLAEAPEFKQSDLTDPGFVARVYRFFGLAPSWTEEGPRVGM